MHIPTVLIGVAAIIFGLYTLWARVSRPEKLGKLEPMKRAFGPTAGSIVHLVAYSITPVAVGGTFLVIGLSGQSIF